MAEVATKERSPADTSAPVEDPNIETEEVEEASEPYELSALRRMHEHLNILLEEYDEFTQNSLHDGFKGHVRDILESLADHLDGTEELFDKLMSEVEGGVEPLEYSGEKDEDDAVPASDDREELPTPDEVVEGMSKKEKTLALQTVALRGKYLKALRSRLKAQPSDTADVSPEKARQILKDGTVHGKPLTDKQRGMFGAIAGKKDMEMGAPSNDNAEAAVNEVDKDANVKFLPHHYKALGGAAGHLHELSETQEFGDEHRMKSYHWHKSLEQIKEELHGESGEMGHKSADSEINKAANEVDVTKKGKSQYGEKAKRGGGNFGPRYQGALEWAQSEDMDNAEEVAAAIAHGGGPKSLRMKFLASPQGKALDEEDTAAVANEIEPTENEEAEHPHMKAIDAASQFLHRMSGEKAYGDEHRTEALEHFKVLDPISHELQETNVEEGMKALTEIFSGLKGSLEGMRKDLAAVKI